MCGCVVGWMIADVSAAPVVYFKHSATMNNANFNLRWHFLWILEALKIKAKRRPALTRLCNVACPVPSFQNEE
jgi:hypothetical protein